MNGNLPIWIMEPERRDKPEEYARILLDRARRPDKLAESLTIDEIKQRLKAIRQEASNNIEQLLVELQHNLRAKYPQVKISVAQDYGQAVDYIKAASNNIDIISTNYSVSVIQELKNGLQTAGFKVINSYLHEYSTEEKKFKDYWDLPRLTDKKLTGSFNTIGRYNGLPQIECRQYLALLGVNAIAADDGTVCFLQHFSNIDRDLRQASKVFLVAGIDKIVKTAEDARFQTQCMGIFGLENIVLGIGPRAESGADVVDIEDMGLPLSDSGRELHLIILDNGRSEMLRGKYRELFLCIGCRACNKHCPIRHALMDVDYMWTPKNYLTQFLYGIGRSLDICLHCQGCHVECPVDINLPYLMWQAKRDFSGEHGISLSHKLLGRPEILARLGTLLAPLANLMMKFRPLRVVMEKVTGIDRRTNLPIFHIDTFRSWYRRHG